jgi:hypothetical protein
MFLVGSGKNRGCVLTLKHAGAFGNENLKTGACHATRRNRLSEGPALIRGACDVAIGSPHGARSLSAHF